MPTNQVVPVVTDAAWMNYPTSVGFTPGRHPRGYLTNGAFYGGQPVSDLMTFRVKA